MKILFTGDIAYFSEQPEKPKSLNKMLEIAQKLSSPFSYVRVDLYELNDGTVLFGEMTFTPAGGMDHWDPPEWNYKLGQLLKLPNKKTLFTR